MLQLLSKQADVWMDDDSVLRLSCFVYGASHFFLWKLPPKRNAYYNKGAVFLVSFLCRNFHSKQINFFRFWNLNSSQTELDSPARL